MGSRASRPLLTTMRTRPSPREHRATETVAIPGANRLAAERRPRQCGLQNLGRHAYIKANVAAPAGP